MLKIRGYNPPDISGSLIKLTLNGLKRVKKDAVRQRDPVKLSHLKRMYRILDCETDLDLMFWAMCLFLFRTLLRVSHVISSPHTLLRKNVKLTDWGMLVKVKSSKTNQYGSKPTCIPVNKLSVVHYCPVFWLGKIFKIQGPNYSGPLFSLPGMSVLDYNWFSDKLCDVVRKSNIKSVISSHSFRKGGATFMSSCDVPLVDIKSRGGWKSNAIFRYLEEPLSKKRSRDEKVCDNIVQGLAFGWSSYQ